MLVIHTRKKCKITSSRRKGSFTFCCRRERVNNARNAPLLGSDVGPRHRAFCAVYPPPQGADGLLAAAFHCYRTHPCSQRGYTSPSPQTEQATKKPKRSHAVGTPAAQDKYCKRREIKKYGRPSSSRRRFTELCRREPARRPAEPERRGQALRVSPRTLIAILPVEPVSHNNAAAGRRARRRGIG